MLHSQAPVSQADSLSTPADDSVCHSLASSFNQLSSALVTALTEAKDPLFSCVSQIWDITGTGQRLNDCLYRSTQLELLFDFKQRRLALDCSPNGQLLAEAMEKLLSLGQTEQIVSTLKAAYKAATGKDFLMPRRIHWDDNDNALYEF